MYLVEPYIVYKITRTRIVQRTPYNKTVLMFFLHVSAGFVHPQGKSLCILEGNSILYTPPLMARSSRNM